MKAPFPCVLFAIATLTGTSCNTNQAGNIKAGRFGDLSHSLGERREARADVRASCDLTPPAGVSSQVLPRRPYLQRMTAGSVDLVWTTNSQVNSGAVVVAGAGGVIAARATATRDASATLPSGGVQWRAAVTGLEPDSLYCYEVQADGALVARDGFRTAPEPGSARPVRFVAFGDSGNGSADQIAVLEQVGAVPFDFMLHLGDIGYESGKRAELEAYFFRIYADLLASFPVFPASGNHEYSTEDAAPFREAFVLPENGAPAGIERWYSYDWGDVHMVALDSERVGAPQADWLDADLTANHLPWTIVYFHRPPFSSGSHGGDANVQRILVPLFVKHRVPLVLTAHDHDYERTKPQDGVTYIVSGGGGRGTRPVGQSSFTAFSEDVCHFLAITVEGDHLILHAIDGVGQEFDSLLLLRPGSP